METSSHASVARNSRFLQITTRLSQFGEGVDWIAVSVGMILGADLSNCGWSDSAREVEEEIDNKSRRYRWRRGGKAE